MYSLKYFVGFMVSEIPIVSVFGYYPLIVSVVLQSPLYIIHTHTRLLITSFTPPSTDYIKLPMLSKYSSDLDPIPL